MIYVYIVSILGVDSTSETNKADLLGEMQILKQAGRHPNIVSLVGACTQEGKSNCSLFFQISPYVLFVCLSVCLPVCLSVCQSLSLSISSLIDQSQPVCLPVCPLVCPSARLSATQPFRLPFCFIFSSVDPSLQCEINQVHVFTSLRKHPCGHRINSSW